MSGTSGKPRLWSDFDGTAVEKYGYTNPRNWAKYPLPGIPGYLDFLKGVEHADVELAGVVTIRKEAARRFVTNLSLRRLGYTSFINPDQVVYAGNEEAKGLFVAEQSRAGVVGMIDDKPHKIGVSILDALVTRPYRIGEGLHHPILLGAVSHPKSQEYITRLAEMATALHIDGLVIEETGPNTAIGLSFSTDERVILDVAQLESYSLASGVDFGYRLHDLAGTTA